VEPEDLHEEGKKKVLSMKTLEKKAKVRPIEAKIMRSDNDESLEVEEGKSASSEKGLSQEEEVIE